MTLQTTFYTEVVAPFIEENPGIIEEMKTGEFSDESTARITEYLNTHPGGGLSFGLNACQYGPPGSRVERLGAAILQNKVNYAITNLPPEVRDNVLEAALLYTAQKPELSAIFKKSADRAKNMAQAKKLNQPAYNQLLVENYFAPFERDNPDIMEAAATFGLNAGTGNVTGEELKGMHARIYEHVNTAAQGQFVAGLEMLISAQVDSWAYKYGKKELEEYIDGIYGHLHEQKSKVDDKEYGELVDYVFLTCEFIREKMGPTLCAQEIGDKMTNLHIALLEGPDSPLTHSVLDPDLDMVWLGMRSGMK